MDKTNNKKVQVLECVLKFMALLDLKPNHRLLNVRVMCGMLVYVLNLISYVMFVFLEANTFWENTNSIFISMAAVMAPLIFILLTINSSKIFKLVGFLQGIYEDRKQFSHFFHLPNNISSRKEFVLFEKNFPTSWSKEFSTQSGLHQNKCSNRKILWNCKRSPCTMHTHRFHVAENRF